MKNNDLVERYIYAATKKMSSKQKKDVSDELRTLIEDMLEERCKGVLPTDKDIAIVLTELGTPEELYEKYNSDSKKCLIGSPHFTTYKLVLKIVLICVCFGMAVAGIVSFIAEPAPVWYIGVFEWIVTVISSLMSAFAVVTLIFAFLYHKDIQIDKISDLNDLPPVPKKNELIPKWEPIVGICISIIFLLVFLFSPQIFCVILDGKNVIPIFNVEVIKNNWLIIIAFTIVGIAKEAVKLIEGQHNKRVMTATLLADVISVLLTALWLTQKNIMNLDFITAVISSVSKDTEIISYIFTNIQYLFLGVIVIALLLDAVSSVIKVLKAESKA